MRGARTSRYVGVAVLGGAAAVALAGCEKPPPAVSVFSGTTTLNEQALCWAFDSDSLAPGQCAQDILQGDQSGGGAVVPIQAGNTVGISVDPVVAQTGWTPTIGGQRIVDAPLTETYFRFTVPLGVPANGVPLQIVAGQDSSIRGVWIFKLQP
jgi:hypothetical protein